MLPWALVLISIPVLFTYSQVINHEFFFFWLQNSNLTQEVNINLLNVYNYLGEVSPFAMLLIYIVCCYESINLSPPSKSCKHLVR